MTASRAFRIRKKIRAGKATQLEIAELREYENVKRPVGRKTMALPEPTTSPPKSELAADAAPDDVPPPPVPDGWEVAGPPPPEPPKPPSIHPLVAMYAEFFDSCCAEIERQGTLPSMRPIRPIAMAAVAIITKNIDTEPSEATAGWIVGATGVYGLYGAAPPDARASLHGWLGKIFQRGEK